MLKEIAAGIAKLYKGSEKVYEEGKKALAAVAKPFNAATEAAQVASRLDGLFQAATLDKINTYTKDKNKKYGFNETTMQQMIGDFASGYQGQGIDESKSADFAMRLLDQTIDYASFFDRKPSEVGELVKATLGGDYGKGGEIGMPVSAAALDEFAKKSGITGENEKAMRAEALTKFMEENAAKIGLDGDWEKYQLEFSNQMAELEQQWKTLRTNIGTFLETPATGAVTALNNLLGAINNLVEQSKLSTFAQDINGYFGNMELSGAELEEITAGITGQVDAVVGAVAEAQGKLDAASLVQGMMRETEVSGAAFQKAYDTLYNQMRDIAQNQGLDVDALTADATANCNAFKEQMNMNALAALTRFTLSSEQSGLSAWGGFDFGHGATTMLGVQEQFKLLGSFQERYEKAIEGDEGTKGIRQYAKDGTKTPEMLKLLEMFDVFSTLTSSVADGVFDQYDPYIEEKYGTERSNMDLCHWVDAYTKNGFSFGGSTGADGTATGFEDIAGSVNSTIPGKLDAVAAAIANKEFTANISVGSYRLGKATMSSQKAYQNAHG